MAFSLETDPSVPVIMVSAFGTVEAAVDAMKLGAYDFITKPSDPEELLQVVNKALLESGKNKELLSPYFDDPDSFTPEIVGQTPAITEVLKTVRRVARSDSNALISGETGVGKESVAREIHLGSSRRTRPFIKNQLCRYPGFAA